MKDTINLLPKKGVKGFKEKRDIKQFLPFVVVSLVLFFLWLVPYVVLLGVRQQHSNQIAQITQTENEIRALSKEESSYRNVFGKTKGAQVVFQREETFLNNLSGVKELVVPPLTIKTITIDKDSAKIMITTDKVAAALSYLTMLEDEGAKKDIFQKLSISSLTVSKTGGYEVKIEGKL